MSCYDGGTSSQMYENILKIVKFNVQIFFIQCTLIILIRDMQWVARAIIFNHAI